jgi:hypothetical protein
MVAVAPEALTSDDALFREVGQGDISRKDLYWSEEKK